MDIFLRYFFSMYCCIYVFTKITNIDMNQKYFQISSLSFSLICASLISFFTQNCNLIFRLVFFFFSFFIFMLILSKTKSSLVLSISFVSFSISYFSLVISGFFLSIIISFFSRKSIVLINPFCIFLGGIIQYFLVHILFHIKRLRKGMPFILHSRLMNIGTLSCLAIVFLLVYFSVAPPSSIFIHTSVLLFILFLAFLLLFWWRRRITLDYVQKLRMDEVESLYKKISDNEQEIEKLNTNNDYLSKVIHKDNKLIPAMEMALHSYLLEAPTMEAEEARQFGADLLSQLQSMSAEREGIISNYQKNTDSHPKIGIYSVDAVILYMEKRAEKFNITYNLRFDNDIKDAIVGFIHERDMLHLLSDLIENAIIAVKDASHREIFLHIGFLQGGLFIDLYDSGIPFEPAVYQDFGNCQHTTHADSGGSGIGLMDIWNLKRKYKASLQIYEYLPDSDIYTKKIRFLFDHRNHFLLQTYRDKEIRSFITRSDLHVFPLKEMKKKDKE